MYFAIYDSVLRYGIQVWGQNRTPIIGDIEKQQEKSIRILNFKSKEEPVKLLIKNMKIMKMKNIFRFNNVLFAYDQINEGLPSHFNIFFYNSRKPTLI